MSKLILNTTYKHHLIVGLIISIWLVGFLIIIRPFDIAELPFLARFQILPPYGVIAFVSYMILVPLQNWLFKIKQYWTVTFEICFLLAFNLTVLIVNFFYYRSSFVNGDFDFVNFTFQIYYPIFLIVLPILLFSRWYLNRKMSNQSSDRIVLKGENKMDILSLSYSDLICIASAENYVEVNYIVNNTLSKKLLRTTLKNIHNQLPEMIKTHRSYLINPTHIQEWKDSKTLLLTKKEVPVSKNYKNTLLSLKNFNQPN